MQGQAGPDRVPDPVVVSCRRVYMTGLRDLVSVLSSVLAAGECFLQVLALLVRVVALITPVPELLREDLLRFSDVVAFACRYLRGAQALSRKSCPLRCFHTSSLSLSNRSNYDGCGKINIHHFGVYTRNGLGNRKFTWSPTWGFWFCNSVIFRILSREESRPDQRCIVHCWTHRKVQHISCEAQI